jgi:hypothetical protein
LNVTDQQSPDVRSHPAELAHFATAAVAAMSIVPLMACAVELGKEPGTEGWQNWLYALLAIATLYLLAVAFHHLGQAWRGQNGNPFAGWSTLLCIGVDLAVAATILGLIVRGLDSRVVLAGLGTALPGLAATAGISAVIAFYGQWRTRGERIGTIDRALQGRFQIAIGLALVAGLIACEVQELPRISPPISRDAVEAPTTSR